MQVHWQRICGGSPVHLKHRFFMEILLMWFLLMCFCNRTLCFIVTYLNSRSLPFCFPTIPWEEAFSDHFSPGAASLWAVITAAGLVSIGLQLLYGMAHKYLILLQRMSFSDVLTSRRIWLKQRYTWYLQWCCTDSPSSCPHEVAFDEHSCASWRSGTHRKRVLTELPSLTQVSLGW